MSRSDQSQSPPVSVPNELDIASFLDSSHTRYGLQELARTRSLDYFLPLLHELFNAGEAKTHVIFTMLHTLMVDDKVRWTRAELDERFHWLRLTSRSYLLQRLSHVGWLEFYREQGMYMVSDKGEALMRILSRLTHGRELSENEGAALAEIEFGQLLDLSDIDDRLKFLRNRLSKHIIRAETALDSESSYRILEIYEQLKSAYRWAEQTRHSLDELTMDDEDNNGWNTIRGVHDNLSKLHVLISKMQLVLQDIQRRQIDISHYGLTYLDFDNYLIHSRKDALSEMMERHLSAVPHAFLTIDENLFNEAAEILARERQTNPDGRGWNVDPVDAVAEKSDFRARETIDFVEDLKALPGTWRGIDTLVQQTAWEIAAYRFSLLTLMADKGESKISSELDLLAHGQVMVEFDTEADLVTVDCGDETRRMTRGRARQARAKRPKKGK